MAAGNSADALDMCHGNCAIDLVLSDLVMPHMTGPELTARIQQCCPGARVVFMSGYTEHAIVDQVTFDPETLFVSKPFSSAVLMAAVQKALGKVVNTESA
jgi:two-component system cell cycle sensor histidine kinase/response regulator CckA